MFGLPSGSSLFSAILVLAVMILPTIVSISENALRAVPKETRRALDADRRAAASLLRCGVEALASAKRLHDELEAVYRPYVSFPALDELAAREISALGL